MGLCKCPKRKVSTLFCFEHRVNVCDFCLVEEHSQCVVKSYLKWLQDSDYSLLCPLCQINLSQSPTIRFLCLDVFHFDCIDKYFSTLPENTTPNGYTCPSCKECIFFSSNVQSPLADRLRKQYCDFKNTKLSFDTNKAVVNQKNTILHDGGKIDSKVENNFNISHSDPIPILHKSHNAENNLLHAHNQDNNYHLERNGDVTSKFLSNSAVNFFNVNDTGDYDEDSKIKYGSSKESRKIKLFFRRLNYIFNVQGNVNRLLRNKMLLTIIVVCLMLSFFIFLYHKTRTGTSFGFNDADDGDTFKFAPYNFEEHNYAPPDEMGIDDVGKEYLKNPMLDPKLNPNLVPRRGQRF